MVEMGWAGWKVGTYTSRGSDLKGLGWAGCGIWPLLIGPAFAKNLKYDEYGVLY